MLNKLTQNRKLKKVTMGISVLTLGVGLITSLSSFDGSGGGGSSSGAGTGQCWKAEKVPCNGIVETYTYDPNTAAFAPSGAQNGATTTDANGTTTTIWLSSQLYWDQSTWTFRYKIIGKTVTYVTVSRWDCATGGTTDCQPMSCSGEIVGTPKICNH